MSRTPVREALRKLEDEGLIESQRNQWTRVSPIVPRHLLEIYPVVQALHVTALRVAFERLGPEHLQAMRTANAAMGEAIAAHRTAEALRCDAAFHRVIVDRAANPILTQLVVFLTERLQRIELAHFDQLESGTASVAEHRALIRAIRAGDLDEAVKQMTTNWECPILADAAAHGAHVPTNGGLVNPAEAIGRLARAAGCYYLLDACQSVGQMPIDVGAIDRKEVPPWTAWNRFPLCQRTRTRGDRTAVHRWACSHLDWRRYLPTAGRRTSIRELGIQLGHACWSWRRRALRHPPRTRIDLAARPGVGGATARRPGRASRRASLRSGANPVRHRELPVSRHRPGGVKAALARKRINVSVTDAEWTRLDMDARGLPALVRASVHYYNTEAEVDALVDVVAALSSAKSVAE